MLCFSTVDFKLSFSCYDFVLQKDNVSNQREHVVHLLANEQSRLRIPEEPEPVGLMSCIGMILLELAFNVEVCLCVNVKEQGWGMEIIIYLVLC